jgi:phosphoglycolate phosphatase
MRAHTKKSMLIFDFDGTIADTLPVAIEIVNALGDEFGFRSVHQEEFLELKHKSIKELLELSGLSWMQLPLFVKRARDLFKEHLLEVHPILGMPETLFALHSRGYRMGILTSNTPEGVLHFLKTNEVHWFEFIHAPDSIFGKSKVIRKIMKTCRLAPAEIVMIGDEVRDIKAAQKAGVASVGVTWGFNSAQLLKTTHPDHVIEEPGELLRLFA